MAPLGCPPQEYWDDPMERCAPCRQLCIPGSTNVRNGECFSKCPEFATTKAIPVSRSTSVGPPTTAFSADTWSQAPHWANSALHMFGLCSGILLVLVVVGVLLARLCRDHQEKQGTNDSRASDSPSSQRTAMADGNDGSDSANVSTGLLVESGVDVGDGGHGTPQPPVQVTNHWATYTTCFGGSEHGSWAPGCERAAATDQMTDQPTDTLSPSSVMPGNSRLEQARRKAPQLDLTRARLDRTDGQHIYPRSR